MSVPMSSKPKQRQKYSREFRSEAVKLTLESSKAIGVVAEEIGVNKSYLYAWVRQARIDDGDGETDRLTTSEKAELTRLKRENRELRMERDFLKNTAAYFAKAKR